MMVKVPASIAGLVGVGFSIFAFVFVFQKQTTERRSWSFTAPIISSRDFCPSPMTEPPSRRTPFIHCQCIQIPTQMTPFSYSWYVRPLVECNLRTAQFSVTTLSVVLVFFNVMSRIIVCLGIDWVTAIQAHFLDDALLDPACDNASLLDSLRSTMFAFSWAFQSTPVHIDSDKTSCHFVWRAWSLALVVVVGHRAHSPLGIFPWNHLSRYIKKDSWTFHYTSFQCRLFYIGGCSLYALSILCLFCPWASGRNGAAIDGSYLAMSLSRFSVLYLCI